MTNRQKTMDLTGEVSLVQETYSAPAYELFSFEVSGLMKESGDGGIGDGDDDWPDTNDDDWND